MPGSLREMLELMAQVVPEQRPRWLPVPDLPATLAAAPTATPLRVADAAIPRAAATPGRDGIPSEHEAILLQSASGEQVRLMGLTQARHAAYARAHHMDYLCRIGPQQSERHPCWDKIPLILEVLRHGAHREIF